MSDFFIEIKTQCQAEPACPEPVEGKPDRKHFVSLSQVED
jgi:hypothetical protein